MSNMCSNLVLGSDNLRFAKITETDHGDGRVTQDDCRLAQRGGAVQRNRTTNYPGARAPPPGTPPPGMPPRSRRIASLAAFIPHMPCTPPPGGVADEHR